MVSASENFGRSDSDVLVEHPAFDALPGDSKESEDLLKGKLDLEIISRTVVQALRRRVTALLVNYGRNYYANLPKHRFPEEETRQLIRAFAFNVGSRAFHLVKQRMGEITADDLRRDMPDANPEEIAKVVVDQHRGLLIRCILDAIYHGDSLDEEDAATAPQEDRLAFA